MVIGKGKRTLEWERERKKLKIEYAQKGITTCEIRLEDCWNNNALSFAHRHNRVWYYTRPEKLGDFMETLLACVPCHNIIDKNEQLKDDIFKLRRDA